MSINRRSLFGAVFGAFVSAPIAKAQGLTFSDVWNAVKSFPKKKAKAITVDEWAAAAGRAHMQMKQNAAFNSLRTWDYKAIMKSSDEPVETYKWTPYTMDIEVEGE